MGSLELTDSSLRAAASELLLRPRFGLPKGDRIFLLLRNLGPLLPGHRCRGCANMINPKARQPRTFCRAVLRSWPIVVSARCRAAAVCDAFAILDGILLDQLQHVLHQVGIGIAVAVTALLGLNRRRSVRGGALALVFDRNLGAKGNVLDAVVLHLLNDGPDVVPPPRSEILVKHFSVKQSKVIVVDLERVEFVEVEVSEGHVAKAAQTVVSSQLRDQLQHTRCEEAVWAEKE